MIFLKCGVFFPPLSVITLSSVQFSHSVVSESLQPHGLQHARLPCKSPTPGAYSNSCPSSQWCHPTISSSVVPFSSCPQSFPASGSFQVSQSFVSGGHSFGVSASVSLLPMNIQDWFPLGLTGLTGKHLRKPKLNSLYIYRLSYRVWIMKLHRQAAGCYTYLHHLDWETGGRDSSLLKMTGKT